MKEIKIGDNEAGQRLDKFLLKYLNKAGKGFIFKMLRKKNITLNGHKADGSERLEKEDILRLFLSDDTIASFQESVNLNEFKGIRPSVVFENKDILALNKPAGLLSQGDKSGKESCREFLIDYMLKKGEINEADLTMFRPSPCNRLDRNTSGLILCGKSLKGEQYLSSIIRDRSIEKYYLTLVLGDVQSSEENIAYGMKDNRENHLHVSLVPKQGYDRIVTGWQCLEVRNGISLLKVHLITGKPHQIRAHLASLGHPVLGDIKYGSEASKKISSRLGIKRQMLHAYALHFPSRQDSDLSSRMAGKELIAPLPQDMKKIIEKIGYKTKG